MESILKKRTTPVKNLESAFEERKTFETNRASAAFPLYLRDGCDLHIVFLNYWTIKNQIPAESILVNIRIYGADGNLVGKYSTNNILEHNQFSISYILKHTSSIDGSNFDGSVFVEVLSTKNIKFSFPAVTAIYQSGNLFSAVHSAGRIKNADEAQIISYTEETNWTCKFEEGISPFFHYFKGPTQPTIDHLLVSLRKKNGEIVKSKKVQIGNISVFGSKIYMIREIFNDVQFNEGDFVSVRVEHNSIFPRLVVGNFHYNKNFMEVTHSFPKIEREDFCSVTPVETYQSMLCGFTSSDLELTTKIFPTNCRGEFDVAYFSQKFDDISLQPLCDYQKITPKLLPTNFNYTLGNEEQFACFRMSGKEVPARLNSSFIYKVKSVKSNYSTDIASGTVSSAYPPKYSHWGHGYCAEGFKTMILIRNNTLAPNKTLSNKGHLRIYGDDFNLQYDFAVNAESLCVLDIGEIINGSSQSDLLSIKCNFISWIIVMTEPSCDTFWVCYRKSDGAIFGDHGF